MQGEGCLLLPRSSTRVAFLSRPPSRSRVMICWYYCHDTSMEFCLNKSPPATSHILTMHTCIIQLAIDVTQTLQYGQCSERALLALYIVRYWFGRVARYVCGAVCRQCCGKAGIAMAVTSVARGDFRACRWRPPEVTRARQSMLRSWEERTCWAWAYKWCWIWIHWCKPAKIYVKSV